MAVLGLLLLVSAVGLGLDVVFQNTSSINVDALGQSFSSSSDWLFIAGVITGAIGLLGVTLSNFNATGVAENRQIALGLG